MRAQQSAQRSATGSVSLPPLPSQLGRPKPDWGIEAPPPPLLVHQVASNQHIDHRSATHTIPPPPLPVQQEAQSQQVHGRLAIRSLSPPPSPVQRAIQPLGVTQPNMQAYEDSDNNGTPPPSIRIPPRFLARSRVIIDTPRSNRRPSPPSDIVNVDRRRRRHITRSTTQDPPSHLPRKCTKKLLVRVPPRRK